MSMLLDTFWSWSALATEYAETMGWISNLLNAINWILWIALILVGAAGAVYAIYIGVKMARADSSEQREESKKRLINIIVSIVVTIALVLFFNTVLPAILSSMGVFDSFENGGQAPNQPNQPGGSSLNTIVNTARVLLRV